MDGGADLDIGDSYALPQHSPMISFWNELKERFPGPLHQFGQWIDRYKTTTDWTRNIIPGIKFHDLPFEMQVGVVGKYFREILPAFTSWETDLLDRESVLQDIMDIFTGEATREALLGADPYPGLKDLVDEDPEE